MKLTILNFTTGHIHIHNVSSQSEVKNHVDSQVHIKHGCYQMTKNLK
jgi:hypothetical protein